MKLKALKKDIFKEIRNTKSRFLSIMAIIAIGTGFFAGVKSTCPDMKDTAEKYYNEQNLMDIHLKSTLGFTDGDIDALSQFPHTKAVDYGYTTDAFVSTDETNAIVRAYSIDSKRLEDDENYINKPVLKEGRMPENSNECLVENGIYADGVYSIGNKITLFFDENEEAITENVLNNDTFTIVGVVESPMYVSFERGGSSIGNGNINSFIYLPEGAFKYDVYTDVYMMFSDLESINSFSKAYQKDIDLKTDQLEILADKRKALRYDEIYSEASNKISDAEKELNDGIDEYNKNKDEFDSKISDAEKEISDGRSQLSNLQKTYDSGTAELINSKQKYSDGLKAITDGEEQLNKSYDDYNKAAEQNNSLISLIGGISEVIDGYSDIYIPEGAQIPEETASVISASSALGSQLGGIKIDELLTAYIRTSPQDIQQKAEFKARLTSIISSLNSTSEENSRSLADAKAQLDAAKTEFENQKQTMQAAQSEIINAEAQLDKLKNGIAEAAAGLGDGEKELSSQKAEGKEKLSYAKAEIQKGQTELDDAKKKLSDIENPEWYIMDRTSNPGYSGYSEDAERIDKIAAVFPVFFILVAALVCLTTMTRMVEEHRTQIGTLKSLGYSKNAVVAKYIVYAVSASLIGSIVGLSIGFVVFPYVIFEAYKIMYIMPPLQISARPEYVILCTAAAVLCTSLAALAACYKELIETPANLMRPKAPKAGKRVLMERIGFIWSRLKFLQKVTVRNLFRYKKRIVMTVVGIAGCTALILTGFGLQYSISVIVDKQFGEVFNYDLITVFDDKASQNERDALNKTLNDNEFITNNMYILQKSLNASANKVQKPVYMIVPDAPQKINEYVNLKNRISNEKLTLSSDGVVITEKLAKMLDLKTGDAITIENSDNSKSEFTVEGIAENYTHNYIYISPELYKESYGENPNFNAFYANIADGTDQDTLSTELLKNNCILSLNYLDGSGNSFRDIVKSLNYIVLVLIISAGALAFVVLYNLANINVRERIREIATIKVLGFFDKEVSAYVYRENTIASIFGILAGLLIGIPFERFVIKTAEVDAVMFAPDINPASFIFAAGLTLLFTIIVNIAMYFTLKKVDMVESLKSIE